MQHLLAKYNTMTKIQTKQIKEMMAQEECLHDDEVYVDTELRRWDNQLREMKGRKSFSASSRTDYIKLNILVCEK